MTDDDLIRQRALLDQALAGLLDVARAMAGYRRELIDAGKGSMLPDAPKGEELKQLLSYGNAMMEPDDIAQLGLPIGPRRRLGSRRDLVLAARRERASG